MHRSLRTSLMIGMAIVIAMMIAQAVTGLFFLHRARVTASEMSSHTVPSIRLLGEIALEATRMRLRASRHAASGDPSRMQEIESQIAEADDAMRSRFAAFEALPADARERAVWRNFTTNWDAYLRSQTAAIAASRRGDKAVADRLIEEERDHFLFTMGLLNGEIRIHDGLAAQAAGDVDRSFSSAAWGVGAVGVGAVLCGFGLWFLFVGRALARLRELAGAMRAVSEGDLTTDVPALDRRDEIGVMAGTLIGLRDRLAEAETLRRQQQMLDLGNLRMMNDAQEELSRRAELLDREVEDKTAELVAREREIVWRLSRATERRDNETGDHIFRMSRISGLVAEALGLPEEDCALIEIASQMHDIGKVGIPDHILFKPGKLTPEERRIMEGHATIGWNILKGSQSRLIRMAADVAGCHHEKWDGSGYPHGLVGEAIPLSARIAALADVFDALMSRRPYKEPWTLDRARAFVVENSGGHFDPACVEAFLARWDEIAAIAGTSVSQDGELDVAAA